ncbi:MAG: class I SAM-dependent methyltransferase [Pseudooceanicola sp.]
MSADPATIGVYDTETERYAACAVSAEEMTALSEFLATMPDGARMLDLGCGPGHAAARMMRAGHSVDAVDASASMVAHARRVEGVDARQARFDEIDAQAAYDGIWASFSLLHAPKTEFPEHLFRLAKALVPGGRLFLGMKTGEGEARDRLGRFYAYYSVAELRGHLDAVGLRVETERLGRGTGLDGEPHAWCLLTARAPD